MEEKLKNIIYTISTGILSVILFNLGYGLYKEFPDQPYLGITIAITAILAVLLLFYTTQIKTNQAKIKKLEEKMDRFESDKDMSEKLLNTIKDIVILNKMYKRGELKWENK